MRAVAEDVYHFLFVWSGSDMHDMTFRDSFTDSFLYTNAATAHNVTFVRNTFVNRSAGDPWPEAALVIMQQAGPSRSLSQPSLLT